MSSLAFLARGRVFVRDEAGAQRALESPFAQTLKQQREDTHRQRALHRRTMMGGLPPGMQERLEKQGPPPMAIRAAGVCAGGPNKLYFALSADRIGGYLSYDLSANREQRLMHSTESSFEHLDRHPILGEVVCTVVASGERQIGLMPKLGRHPQLLTEGDALVLAPRWVPGEERTVVFAAAGMARDGNGFLRERAPFEIERLNVETGALDTLAREEKHDLLGPVLDASGALYAIRRPFRPLGYKPPAKTFAQSLLDVVLFLPRFGAALVGWANFFSWQYRGKGLTSQTPFDADDPERGERAAPVRIQAWGEVLTPQVARKLGRRDASEDEAATWVSKEWQLVHRTPGSAEWQVLAEGVLAFDVAPDGTTFFCDGGRLFRLKSDGTKEKLCSEAGIENVRVLI